MYEVNATDCIESLTVTVKVKGLLRLKLGVLLVGLAARLLQCRLVVNGTEVADAG